MPGSFSSNAVKIIKTVFGADHAGATTVRSADTVNGLNLSGRGIPLGLRYGMKGGISSFQGDLGPLQAFGPVGHARNAIRSGMGKGLPSTHGNPQQPITTRDLLGPGPL